MNTDTSKSSQIPSGIVATKGDYWFHIIVFSFNRAMQCESVLRSILKYVKTSNLELSVIWHATGPHEEGYALLRRMYEPKGVRFYERSGRIGFFRHVLPRLWMPRNLYHWLKYDYVRKADNFKPLVERVIVETPSDFVSFNTDDTVYFRDETLPRTAFRYLRDHPYGGSYRTYIGGNLPKCPKTIQHEEDVLRWDYLDPAMSSHWAFPFAVDGTYFDRAALLDVIGRVLYHNPVTLENYLCSYTRSQRLFHEGFSPLHSTLIGLPLNKVSNIAPQNRHGSASVETLNKLFLDGYLLEYELPEPQIFSSLVPERIIAVRGDERVAIPVTHKADGV